MKENTMKKLQEQLGKSGAAILNKFFNSVECHNNSTGKIEDLEAVIETRDNCLLGFFKGKEYQSLNALYLKSGGTELHLQECSSGGVIVGEEITLDNILMYNKSMTLKCDNIKRVYFHDGSVWEVNKDTMTERILDDVVINW